MGLDIESWHVEKGLARVFVYGRHIRRKFFQLLQGITNIGLHGCVKFVSDVGDLASFLFQFVERRQNQCEASLTAQAA